jgi:hypothetical protein
MSTLKLVLGLAVIVGVAYVCWMLIPPYFANYQFEDEIKNTAINGTYSTKSEEEIQNVLLKKAQELEIPLTKNQIKISREGSAFTGSMTIDCDYTVHVDLPGYPLDLHFHPSTKNKSIM